MMNRLTCWIAALICLPIIAAGCNKKPNNASEPPTANNAQQQADDVTAPTTQAILSATRPARQLVPYPFTLDLPFPYWSVDPPPISDAKHVDEIGGPTVTQIRGPAPAGDIEIDITPGARIPLPMRSLDEKAARLRQLQDQHPQSILKVIDYPFGGGKALESRVLTHFLAAPATGPSGTTRDAADSVEWEIMIMIPHPDKHSTTPKYDAYKLSVFELTPEQYTRDQKFLEEILGSLKYVPSDAP